MKIIIIMGVPGTGKTTLMRRFMQKTGTWEEAFTSFKLVPFHFNADHRIVVLGKYEEGEVFAGTDRMSMAVQPEAIKFLAWQEEIGTQVAVFEGDRLTNQSFIEHCLANYDTRILFLTVDDSERERRYAERGSNQSEQFIRGRMTKYSNLRGNFDIMMAIEEFEHSTPEHTDTIVSHIIDLVNE